MNNSKKMRVWWIPQVGMLGDPFYIPVKTVEEGKKFLDLLSAYDIYQLDNRIKPDFCNTGGIEVFNEEEKEWEDWNLDTENYYYEDAEEYCESDDCPMREELEEFKKELFNQLG